MLIAAFARAWCRSCQGCPSLTFGNSDLLGAPDRGIPWFTAALSGTRGLFQCFSVNTTLILSCRPCAKNPSLYASSMVYD